MNLKRQFNLALPVSIPDGESGKIELQRNSSEAALDAPERRIELVYADGSEYTLCNARETSGPIFADTERIILDCMDKGLEGRFSDCDNN